MWEHGARNGRTHIDEKITYWVAGTANALGSAQGNSHAHWQGDLMFGRGTFTIARVRGIPVRVHWSLLIVIPYLALILTYQFPVIARTARVDPGAVAVPRFVWGILLSAGLFLSVLLHELAHSVVAIWRGSRVKEIILMAVGGVSVIETMPRKRWEQGLVAAVGPLLSLLLGGLLYLAYWVTPAGAADVRFGVFYLAQTNLILGLFNLLPAFPLDGGRIFRALLAGWLGAARATVVSARIGKGLAAGLIVLGLFGGSFLTMLVGLFLYLGAEGEARAQVLRDALSGVRVRDLMMRDPVVVPASASLADAAALLLAGGRAEAIALDETGEVLGIVRARDLARVTVRGPVSVRGLGERLRAGAAFVSADRFVDDVLERHPEAEVFVVKDPSVVGLLSRQAIDSAVSLLLVERQLGGGATPAPPRPRRA
jgi:Zn-dependent protease